MNSTLATTTTSTSFVPNSITILIKENVLTKIKRRRGNPK